MKFSEIIQQSIALLQRSGRITYRTLKREFSLDDEALEDLKFELIEGQELAVDKDGKMLVWTGNKAAEEIAPQITTAAVYDPSPSTLSDEPEQTTAAGERRQLTVMFCDLVGSTSLSEQLDPEELQTVVRTFQEVSAQVIERYAGHIAQYLGDGLLVYFGYPLAHEDDATRAVRVGLEILEALADARKRFPEAVHVRIGVHTGPVVVGEMGGGSRHEQLALGETPNIAARVQGYAEPNTVVISAATQQLVAGLFEIADLGRHELKGISTPQVLYRVDGESAVQSRFEAAVRRGLTPLVGRESELGVLTDRWTQAQAGEGQVVLLNGEPGIGKSRLVEELKAQVPAEGATQIELRCSPYYQNTALYPITEHLQRLLQFAPDDTPATKLDKLEQMLGNYRFPQANTFPLLATLLALPQPEGVPPLTVSPQKQKELTQAALVAWLIEESDQCPVFNAWEDLHWADASTLELLDLLLAQVPSARLLLLLTFRPEFIPPWRTHSYLSQLTLSRLGSPQVGAMAERVTGGKALPEEVIEQIVTKTDGVPLFVEELTKMVVESDLVRAVNDHYELTAPLPSLAIPSTLQDSLMARLDRLPTVREMAQLGATLGREFTYELLAAVSPLEEDSLQLGLKQLVEAELVYQRGLPPQARYIFKHALIQDTAYESLLKSRRQQLHQQVAQVLEQQFAETVETQPELVAYHYTEAGLAEQAIHYWQRAAQRGIEHSAHAEAIGHVTKALSLLTESPPTAEQIRQEIMLQVMLGAAFMATKGYAAQEAGQALSRARELCQQVEDNTQLFRILWGLWTFHNTRGEHQTARELGEEYLQLAQRNQVPIRLLQAHEALGGSLYYLGEFAAARTYLEKGIALYDPQKRSARALQDPGVDCRVYVSLALWFLGYPDQSLDRLHEALNMAQELSHPMSIAVAKHCAALVHLSRGEIQATQEQAEATISISTEHGFALWVSDCTVLRGWALSEQGQGTEGISQIRGGQAALRAMGVGWYLPYHLALLAEAYERVGQTEEGLAALDEALMLADKTAERFYKAELHRLKGELILQKAEANPQARALQAEAEACFEMAVDVARQQSAKSLELRAVISLGRLWQQQDKKNHARQMLTEIYNWFTEGFDTKDLQDAKILLAELD